MFRVLQGINLLTGSYFDPHWLIYGLIVVLLFEGITNLRIPLLISRMRGVPVVTKPECALSSGATRINFEAERALRLTVAGFPIISYLLFSEQLWFFLWFSRIRGRFERYVPDGDGLSMARVQIKQA